MIGLPPLVPSAAEKLSTGDSVPPPPPPLDPHGKGKVAGLRDVLTGSGDQEAPSCTTGRFWRGGGGGGRPEGEHKECITPGTKKEGKVCKTPRETESCVSLLSFPE